MLFEVEPGWHAAQLSTVPAGQIGQLLLFLRVSPKNRLLPFVTQLIDLIHKHTQAPAAAAAAVAVTTGGLESLHKSCLVCAAS